MNVAVIGKGGREHALVLALSQSPSVGKLYAIPGGDGFVQATVINISPDDQVAILKCCRDENIELVVVGPENYLVAGLADFLRENGVLVFGPSARSSKFEGSKQFSKDFMVRNQIPTARSFVVSTMDELSRAMGEFSPPYVLKADGLAGGKGVYICSNQEQLMEAGAFLWQDKGLGDAGKSALLEEFQQGNEISFFILTNGKSYQTLPLAGDHKRLLEGDLGPNTGGMGTIAPLKIPDPLYQEIIEQVVEPTIAGLEQEGFDYRGVLFIGLMMTSSGPSVLEYNVRFGDPETQVLLPLLDGDWGEVFAQVANGEVPKLQWKQNFAAACVVMAAKGYPSNPVKGSLIKGLRDLPQSISSEKNYVLHAGTRKEDGQWLTHGGRVLNAMGVGPNIEQALRESYQTVDGIHWDGVQFRKDIGKGRTSV